MAAMFVKRITIGARRGAAFMGLAAVAAGSCHLDGTGKNHCLTMAECHPGNACIAETCVAFDSDGAVWSPPLVYLAGVRRSACDAFNGTYTAAEAMRRAGFTSAPYMVTMDNAEYVVGVNQDTRLIVSLMPSKSVNDFWFEVFATTEAAGPTAQRWRDQVLAQLRSLTLPCDATAGDVSTDGSLVSGGPPGIYYDIGSMWTPTACGGVALCSSTARDVMIANGIQPGPSSASATRVVGISGDTSVVVDCADFGTYALFMVFTSGPQMSGIDLSIKLTDAITAAGAAASCAAVCGDHVVQQGEQCDPPNGSTCGNDCKLTVDCPACEMTSSACDPTALTPPGGTGSFGCDGFTGAVRSSCMALLDCIRSNHCASASDPSPCFCGAGVDPTACATGAATPNGVCLPQYYAALADGPAGTVFTLFYDPSSPIGIADNLFSCDVNASCPCGQ
jgi:hypothetical protein